MAELELEYRKRVYGSQVTHHFGCYGPEAVIDIWVANDDSEHVTSGIECHYRNAPDYMAGKEPSRTNCTFTGGNCWHDGSSLYAMEHFLPLWQATRNIDSMLFHAKAEYVRRFRKEEE